MFCVYEWCATGTWVDSTGPDPGDSSSPLEDVYITVDGRQKSQEMPTTGTRFSPVVDTTVESCFSIVSLQYT